MNEIHAEEFQNVRYMILNHQAYVFILYKCPKCGADMQKNGFSIKIHEAIDLGLKQYMSSFEPKEECCDKNAHQQ